MVFKLARFHFSGCALVAASYSDSQVLRRIHQAALRLFAETGATHVSISELAQAAGVARGTIYNNLTAPEALFEVIASELGDEMHQRVLASFGADEQPAQRLANGVRFFIRRTHDEPDWGRFLCRFAFSSESMRTTLNSPLAQEILSGSEAGCFHLQPQQLLSAMALIAGTVLSSMLLVREGLRTWRDAGADCAELLLRALGVPADEARRLALSELPPLLPATA